MTTVLPLFAAVANEDDPSMWTSMFIFEIPPTEKLLRTVAVYAAMVVILRLAGKRQMAQLNNFDLVVALLLSNVVQNAIIGNDNSLVGGLLGAVVLIAVNGLVDRLCFSSPLVDRVFNGRDTRLICDGSLDGDGMRSVGLTRHDLLSVLHRQGADHIHEVQTASISPGGNITIELKKHEQNVNKGEFDTAVRELTTLVETRFAALEAAVRAQAAR